jgi:hypothetical protein
VMLAGPGVPGDSLSLLQMIAQGTASGVPSDRLHDAVRVNRMLFTAVGSARDSTDAVARIAAAKKKLACATPTGQTRRSVPADR